MGCYRNAHFLSFQKMGGSPVTQDLLAPHSEEFRTLMPSEGHSLRHCPLKL